MAEWNKRVPGVGAGAVAQGVWASAGGRLPDGDAERSGEAGADEGVDEVEGLTATAEVGGLTAAQIEEEVQRRLAERVAVGQRWREEEQRQEEKAQQGTIEATMRAAYGGCCGEDGSVPPHGLFVSGEKTPCGKWTPFEALRGKVAWGRAGRTWRSAASCRDAEVSTTTSRAGRSRRWR